MRYPADHKERTREKLLRDAGALAKSVGFAGTGVDALARSAGLTSGAFYKHFESREALFAAVCEGEFHATRARFESLRPGDDASLLAVVDGYLSLWHLRNPELGCPFPTLATEVARAPDSVRAIFEDAQSRLVDVLARLAGDRTLALAVFAQCVGAVVLARAVETDAAKLEVLGAAREGVRRLLAARESARED